MKFLLAILSVTALQAASPLREAVGGGDWSAWKGLGAGGELGLGEASYTFPEGAKGWYQQGFRACHDGSGDWRDRSGLRLKLILGGDEAVELGLRIRVPDQPGRVDWVQETKASVVVSGAGEHELVMPWSGFDFFQAQPAFLKFVKTLGITARQIDGGGSARVVLKSVEVIRGEVLVMDAEIRGKAGVPGETVEYPVRVGNASDRPQAVRLQVQRHGWEAMTTTVSPEVMELAPGETKAASVRVMVDPRVPAAGQERQVIRAIPNGDGARAAEVGFCTVSRLAAPYILHTKQRWDEVRAKVAAQAWAQREQRKFVELSDKWQVPEIAMPHKHTPDNLGEYLVETAQEANLMAAAYAWQLTRDRAHAQKAAMFLRRLSNPATGYSTTLRGCNQSMVQEGHFSRHQPVPEWLRRILKA